MNEFHTVIEFIKSHFEQDIDVNTITHGAVEETDVNKKNIFPIVHIQVLPAQIVSGNLIFGFKVTALDIRNIKKEVVTDKWLGNDNELWNLGTMFTVLNRFVTKLKTQYNEHDIELVGEPSINPIEAQFTNLLDGWEVDVNLQIPNTSINVC